MLKILPTSKTLPLKSPLMLYTSSDTNSIGKQLQTTKETCKYLLGMSNNLLCLLNDIFKKVIVSQATKIHLAIGWYN